MHRHKTLPPDARIIPPASQPQHYTPALEAPASPRGVVSPPRSHDTGGGRGFLHDVLGTLIPALIIAILIHLFLAQATRVEGYSMEPTLYGHQRLIIEKLSYHLHPPQRGDIVVLLVPEYDKYLIKRVIGLPGETLAIRNGVVYINGEPLDEPYVNGTPRGNYPPVTIPEGYVFVMGDNRNNSSDSRVFGPVPIDHIVGHAWLRYWPVQDISFFP